MSEQAWVSPQSQRTGVVACELCGLEGIVSNAAVVVRHPRGGAVQFAVCHKCVVALRRLAAATGWYAAFALTEGGDPTPST